jgi:FkbM family methyltransferase
MKGFYRVMTLREWHNFIRRRYKYDTKKAFLARLGRFGVLALYSIEREKQIKELKRLPTSFVTVDLLNRTSMTLDTKDKGISADLFLDRTREPYIAEKWIPMIEKSDIVVDIGANIGYYAIPEAMKAHYVYAIEPISANNRLLQVNIGNNRLKNIEVYGIAVGDDDRADYINVSSMRNMCSMIKKDGYREYLDKELVYVRSLDSFMADKPYPTVVRMDVEGYELQVLRGMKELLAQNKPMKLFIEVHFDILMDKTKELLDILKENRFELKYATFECHPAVINHKIGGSLVGKMEQIMGAGHGYLDLKLNDLYKKEFISGQVEDLETVFVRN